MNNLIVAYKKCGKEPLAISKLADKYCDLYTRDAYVHILKKCPPRKSLKRFLENQTTYFEVNEDEVRMKKDDVKGDHHLKISKQSSIIQPECTSNTGNDEVHQTSDTGNDNIHQTRSAAVLSHKTILVHFHYGTKHFPREIKCMNIEIFKEEVFGSEIPMW